MSRQIRLEYPGSLNHVTSRGNERRDIFRDDKDREYFLELLGTCVKRFDWILTAYVLMTNHFHLVVQLTRETLSTGMGWLNGKYVQAFNRRHRRVGHLYQDRPDIRPVEEESYGLEVLRYVVLNPVRAGMVSRPEDYVWSSHRAIIGEAPVPDWLAVDDLLVQFGQERELARAAYRDFVNAAIGFKGSLWAGLANQAYLGSDDWMETVRSRIDLKPRCNAYSRAQRLVPRMTMDGVIRTVAEEFSIDEAWVRCGRGGIPRMLAAWIAWSEGELTSTEIAAGLRLRCPGYVSRLVRRCEKELQEDVHLQERLSTISRKVTSKAAAPFKRGGDQGARS